MTPSLFSEWDTPRESTQEPLINGVITIHCFFRCPHIAQSVDPQMAHDLMEHHYTKNHSHQIDQIVSRWRGIIHMTIPQLRKLAGIYGCHIDTATIDFVPHILIQSPNYGEQHEMRQSELAFANSRKIVTICEQLSGKKTADLWANGGEVKR